MLTQDQIIATLNGIEFDVDHREPPDNLRCGQFAAGWGDATVRAREYSPEVLRKLTWHNLGYRFGRAHGEQSDAEIKRAYEVVVSQWPR